MLNVVLKEHSLKIFLQIKKKKKVYSLAIQCCHPNCASGNWHASYKCPLLTLRIPPLHCVQITPAIMASHSIDRAFQYCHTCNKGERKSKWIMTQWGSQIKLTTKAVFQLLCHSEWPLSANKWFHWGHN